MKNVFRIIKKNLKLLIRAKSSAIIIILAPLLIILLVGIAFDNANTYGLNIGVYSPTYNQDIELFIQKLSEKEFKIIEYQDKDRCISDIKLGSTHTCIVFPANLNFNSNEQKKITFYIDYSKINLVWMIMDTLSSGIAARSEEISKDLTGIIVSKLESTKKNLNENKPAIVNIKSQTNNILIKAQEVNQNLAAIDLSFNASSFPTTSAQNLLTNISDSIDEDVSSGKDYISSAKSTISSSSASASDKEDAINDLNNAISKLNSAKSQLSTDSSNNESIAVVLNQINQIKTQITNTQTRLSSASTAKVSSQTKMNEVETTLVSTLNSLGSIETMFSNLLSEIEGLKVTDPEAIASPITTEIKPITAQKTYLNYLFPSLMILVVMFISILLGTTLVLMEKHSPAYFRNFISPTRKIVFIISTYLTNILLVFVQLVIIFGIAMYFFSAQIIPSLHIVALILIISATFFSLLGMAIGYLFTSEETATLASISLGSLFLFISSTIIPIESMPEYVRQIAFYNPFVVAERLLRESILFQPSIKLLANDFYLLLGYSFVLFLFIWGSQKLISKHYLQKLAYRHHKKVRAKSKTKAHKLKTHEETKETEKPVKKTEIRKQEEKKIEHQEKNKEKEKIQKTPPKSKPIPKVVIPHQTKAKSISTKPRPRRPLSSSRNPLVSELERINQELAKLR